MFQLKEAPVNQALLPATVQPYDVVISPDENWLAVTFATSNVPPVLFKKNATTGAYDTVAILSGFTGGATSLFFTSNTEFYCDDDGLPATGNNKIIRATYNAGTNTWTNISADRWLVGRQVFGLAVNPAKTHWAFGFGDGNRVTKINVDATIAGNILNNVVNGNLYPDATYSDDGSRLAFSVYSYGMEFYDVAGDVYTQVLTNTGGDKHGNWQSYFGEDNSYAWVTSTTLVGGIYKKTRVGSTWNDDTTPTPFFTSSTGGFARLLVGGVHYYVATQDGNTSGVKFRVMKDTAGTLSKVQVNGLPFDWTPTTCARGNGKTMAMGFATASNPAARVRAFTLEDVVTTFGSALTFDKAPRRQDSNGKVWQAFEGGNEPSYQQYSLTTGGYSLKDPSNSLTIWATEFIAGTQDFDVKIDVYLNDTSSEQILFMNRGDANGGTGANVAGQLMLEVSANTFVLYPGITSASQSPSGTPFVGWNHIKLTRRGTTYTIFNNGVQVLSVTGAANLPFGRWTIGSDDVPNNTAVSIRGYLDTFSFGNFTPISTAQKISLNFDSLPRNVDTQGRNWVTVAGRNNPAYVQQSLVSGGYSLQTTGGGVGGLTAYDPELVIGTSDFTMVCDFFLTGMSGEQAIVTNRGDGSGGLGTNIDGQFTVALVGSTLTMCLGSTSFIQSGTAILGWNNLIISRQGGVISVTLNRALVYSAANGNNFYSGRWTVGNLDKNNLDFPVQGYVDTLYLNDPSSINARKITHTFDAAPRNVDGQSRPWATVTGFADPAYVQQSLTPGGYSLQTVNGGGLTIYDPNLVLGLNDFTLTTDFFLTDTGTEAIIFMNRGDVNGGTGNVAGQFIMEVFSNTFVLYFGNTSFAQFGQPVAGWNKIEVKRIGTSVTVKHNNTIVATPANANLPYGRWTVAQLDNTGGSLPLRGYMDTFRVSPFTTDSVVGNGAEVFPKFGVDYRMRDVGFKAALLAPKYLWNGSIKMLDKSNIALSFAPYSLKAFAFMKTQAAQNPQPFNVTTLYTPAPGFTKTVMSFGPLPDVWGEQEFNYGVYFWNGMLAMPVEIEGDLLYGVYSWYGALGTIPSDTELVYQKYKWNALLDNSDHLNGDLLYPSFGEGGLLKLTDFVNGDMLAPLFQWTGIVSLDTINADLVYPVYEWDADVDDNHLSMRFDYTYSEYTWDANLENPIGVYGDMVSAPYEWDGTLKATLNFEAALNYGVYKWDVLVQPNVHTDGSWRFQKFMWNAVLSGAPKVEDSDLLYPKFGVDYRLTSYYKVRLDMEIEFDVEIDTLLRTRRALFITEN